MAKLENIEYDKEVRVASKEIVKNTSVFRQAKSEFLVMIRTLLYYMSVCNNSENGCRRPDSLNRNIMAAGEDVGKNDKENDKKDEDGEKITTRTNKEDDDSISNGAGCWSIEIIEEEEEERGNCLCLGVEDWLTIFIYFSMLILIVALVLLYLIRAEAKMK